MEYVSLVLNTTLSIDELMLSFILFLLILIWYDSTLWLHCIAKCTTVNYYSSWIGMIAQYDRAEDLWIWCIAEYTATHEYLYMYDITKQ